jgi:hypothetical protein
MAANTPAVTAVSKFERFFRVVAGLDIDKEDLRRYNDFINKKITDLLVRAQAVAKANGRDIMMFMDVPITKGLRACMFDFRRYDREVELTSTLDELTPRPQLDFAYSEELDQQLPEIAGGLTVALARSFGIIDPAIKNPSSEHWDRSMQVFNLLI